MPATTKESIIDTKQMIEELKKLPENKQEYIKGYTQGILETLSTKKEPA